MSDPRDAFDRDKHDDRPPWEDDEAEDDDGTGAPRSNGSAAAGAAGVGLPVIKMSGGSLALNRAEAEAALALHGMRDPMHAVYQRGGALVRIHRIVRADQGEADAYGVRRAVGTPMITPVEPGFLHCHLAEVAAWARYDARSKKDVLVNPPKDVVRPLLDGPWTQVPPLSGILETPALLPDGTLLAGSGYHAATGFLLDTITIPPVTPSRRAAEAALKTLPRSTRGFRSLPKSGSRLRSRRRCRASPPASSTPRR